MQIEYKGYVIDDGFTYPNMITVFVCGDDIICGSIDQAKEEIDKLITDENFFCGIV